MLAALSRRARAMPARKGLRFALPHSLTPFSTRIYSSARRRWWARLLSEVQSPSSC